MKIELLAVGTRPPGWVTEGFREYCKRLPKECRLELREFKVAQRTKGSVEQWKEDEAGRMISAIDADARVIALDRAGKVWSTEELAGKLTDWMENYRTVHMLIGGPDGLGRTCLDAAQETWSLSRLTFPHFLVRVMIAEQIWRAVSINNNHPYHK